MKLLSDSIYLSRQKPEEFSMCFITAYSNYSYPINTAKFPKTKIHITEIEIVEDTKRHVFSTFFELSSDVGFSDKRSVTT